MLATTTQLNTPGMKLAELSGVHAMTDVTGFGLAGHLLEVCRGSNLGAAIRFDDLPVLADSLAWAKKGVVTGASARNWAGYGHEVNCPAEFADWKRNLLSDPQTSGGLLVACAPETADQVVEIFKSDGFALATRIGSMTQGNAVLTIG